MQSRQELILVSKMVLSELTRRVAMRLKTLCDRGILSAHTHVGARHSYLGQPRANRVLSSDECCPASSAALLAVVVGKGDALVGDAIDVRRTVPHLSAAVIADVPPADVVTP